MKRLKLGVTITLMRAERFKALVLEEWKRRFPEVTLELVDWDNGYLTDPTEDIDVYMYDAAYQETFKAQKLTYPIDAALVPNLQDFPDSFRSNIFETPTTLTSIPMYNCGTFLFYRETDQAIAAAKTIQDLLPIFEDGSSHISTEAIGGNIMFAFWYLEILHQLKGTILPLTTVLDPSALGILKRIGKIQDCFALMSLSGATDSSTIRFTNGKVRAFYNYSEFLAGLSPSVLATMKMKIMPWNTSPELKPPLFFGEYVSLNPTTVNRGMLHYATQLALLISSEEFLTADLFGSGQDFKYTLPARMSLFNKLAAVSPVYQQLLDNIISSQPIMCNLGMHPHTPIVTLANLVTT